MLMPFQKVFLKTLLISVVCSGFFTTAICEDSEFHEEEILNYLNYNLERGLNIGLLNFIYTLDSYELLRTELPNKNYVIELLNSIQSNEGTWATGRNHYVPITAQILMFYNRSGVKPAKSLEPFFATVDTWEEVADHVQLYDPGNSWGGLWGYVMSYVVYKGERPPWTQDFLNATNAYFDSWANSNHQRTHLIHNLYQINVPVPRVDEVVNIALQQQTLDGSWDNSLPETVFMIGAFKLVRNQTTLDQTLIDSAITRSLNFINSCYRRIESQGKTYAGFAINPSEANPDPRSTALGIYALLNPESDVWSKWIVNRQIYTFIVPFQGSNYTITVLSNSTITNFYFNHSLKQIGFRVTGLNATTGYCNVSIPRTFMWCDNPAQWNITFDSYPIDNLTVFEEENQTRLVLTYTHSTHEIVIMATHLISEFPLSAIMLITIMTVLFGVILLYSCLKKIKEKTK